jgi:NADH-quinone oxidoreductase subunit H
MEKIILNDLVYYLLFPGFAFLALSGMVVSWLDRKVTARVQWRVGPPFLQPFYDLQKLFYKESFAPAGGNRLIFALAPVLAVIAVVLISDIMLLAFIDPTVSFLGDLIVVMYFFTLIPLSSILGASASNSPYASLGASREMKAVLAYELPLILSLLVPVVKSQAVSIGKIVEMQSMSGSFAGEISGFIAFLTAFLCIQAKMGLAPFDMSEAETEIAAGTCVEYSGPFLAIWKLSKMMLLVVAPLFVVIMFWGGGPKYAVFFKYLTLITLAILIKNTNPRVRIDQAVRFFWKKMLLIAVLALLLAVIGY